MQLNVGKTDKSIRYLVGVAALTIGLIYNSWWGLIGLVPIVTAVIGFCPLWTVFGISTKKETETGN